ncbi:biopolymer transporter ExbD [Mameliella alba]|nr:biopolymer transporter ExbD [Antarctobacter heliothermus]MBY6143412.1 biopolymer transporter ExbD [Mameliella alba]MCA0952863.1 biopolymer transporter ExbD [Mameliella alba]
MRRRRPRRRLSMTSLIDVIFLLLLFFMLSSTFTRFGEVELAAGGGSGALSPVSPVFLRLGEDQLSLNGTQHPLAALPEVLQARQAGVADDLPVVVALQGGVSAQRLTDLLAALRGMSGLRITVLGAV